MILILCFLIYLSVYQKFIVNNQIFADTANIHVFLNGEKNIVTIKK